MTTKHSKDHYRTTKTGQRVLVHGHDYEVKDEDFENEFQRLFGGDDASAPKAAKGPDAPAVEADPFETEFDRLFGGPDEPKPEPAAPEAPGLKVGEKVPFASLKRGMKLTSPMGQHAIVTKVEDGVVFVDKNKAVGGVSPLEFDENEWNGVPYLLAPDDAPEPGVAEATEVPGNALSGKIAGLAVGGVLNSGSIFISASGVKAVRSKGNNGAFLFIQKKLSNDSQPIPAALKAAIAAIPGFQQNSSVMKPKQQWMQIPFSQADKLEEAIAAHESGTLAKPKKAAKAPAATYEPGATVPFDGLKAGMAFLAESGTTYTIAKKNPQSVMITIKQANGYSYDGKVTAKNWAAGYEGAVKLQGEAQHHVGDTKTENGKTYVLNANHKWELAPGQEDPKVAGNVSPLSSGTMDAWKQVGPQKGSNPGGLFEDAMGKKWYVKFPATEDHAKNELLAAKLYKMAGLAAPNLKLVKKDGKVGIASEFVEGLKNDAHALKYGAHGAKEGFGVDAWLANWDSFGATYDNMPIDKEGKAIRIDVGGSLLYRAQGTAKTEDEFGNTVKDVETLRNPLKNANAAAVFGSMGPQELDRSVSKVLEIPDDVIKAAVEKWGPGDAKAKADLAAKLIARKADLAKKFPKADLIANPPPPDPAKLPVKPDDFPKVPNFSDWGGAGKGLSSKPEVNAQNQELADKIYAVATSGNLTALKALTHVPVGGGEPKSMADAKSQHIRAMYEQCINTLNGILANNGKKPKDWGLDEFEGGTLGELLSGIKSFDYGVTKHNAPAGKRLGFWLSLGDAPGAEHLAPKDEAWIAPAEVSKGKASAQGIPQMLKTFMQNVKSSGSANDPYRDGLEKDHAGNKCRDVIKAAYDHAFEFKEGTKLTRFQNETYEDKGMIQALLGKKPGHIFENPGSMCTSYKPGWNWGGSMKMEIVCAKGAKGLFNVGVGSHDTEQEVTTLPGQRFMLLHQEMKGGQLVMKVLMLPPDPAYVDNLKIGAAA